MAKVLFGQRRGLLDDDDVEQDEFCIGDNPGAMLDNTWAEKSSKN